MPRSRRSLYSKDYEALLDMLVRAREEAGLTQVQLAKQMATSQSMLSKIERGVVRMDLMDLLAYLKGIKLDPRAFIKQYLAQIGWR